MRKFGVLLSALVLVMALAGGCADRNQASAPESSVSSASDLPTSEHHVDAPAAPISAKPTNKHAKKPDNEAEISSASSPDKAAGDSKTTQPAKQESSQDDTSTDPAPKKSKPKDETSKLAQYSLDHPSLAGFEVGADKQKVVAYYGEPKQKYVMQDTSPITVYQYNGFMIGFNQQQVVFITITSADAEPGLNGFRLGQGVDEAVKDLGDPTQQSDYLLSYESNGTMLKLDVDPKTQTVLSIKLFAAS